MKRVRAPEALSVLVVIVLGSAGAASSGCAARVPVVTPSALAYQEKRLVCSASAPAAVRAGAPLPVAFSVRNVGAVPIRVARDSTPLARQPRGNWFVITCDGRRMRSTYTITDGCGGEPEAANFVTVAPGEEVSATHDLSASYELATAGAHCQIAFKSPSLYISEDLKPQGAAPLAGRTALVDCAPARVEVVP